MKDCNLHESFITLGVRDTSCVSNITFNNLVDYLNSDCSNSCIRLNFESYNELVNAINNIICDIKLERCVFEIPSRFCTELKFHEELFNGVELLSNYDRVSLADRIN